MSHDQVHRRNPQAAAEAAASASLPSTSPLPRALDNAFLDQDDRSDSSLLHPREQKEELKDEGDMEGLYPFIDNDEKRIEDETEKAAEAVILGLKAKPPETKDPFDWKQVDWKPVKETIKQGLRARLKQQETQNLNALNAIEKERHEKITAEVTKYLDAYYTKLTTSDKPEARKLARLINWERWKKSIIHKLYTAGKNWGDDDKQRKAEIDLRGRLGAAQWLEPCYTFSTAVLTGHDYYREHGFNPTLIGVGTGLALQALVTTPTNFYSIDPIEESKQYRPTVQIGDKILGEWKIIEEGGKKFKRFYPTRLSDAAGKKGDVRFVIDPSFDPTSEHYQPQRVEFFNHYIELQAQTQQEEQKKEQKEKPAKQSGPSKRTRIQTAINTVATPWANITGALGNTPVVYFILEQIPADKLYLAIGKLVAAGIGSAYIVKRGNDYYVAFVGKTLEKSNTQFWTSLNEIAQMWKVKPVPQQVSRGWCSSLIGAVCMPIQTLFNFLDRHGPQLQAIEFTSQLIPNSGFRGLGMGLTLAAILGSINILMAGISPAAVIPYSYAIVPLSGATAAVGTWNTLMSRYDTIDRSAFRIETPEEDHVEYLMDERLLKEFKPIQDKLRNNSDAAKLKPNEEARTRLWGLLNGAFWAGTVLTPAWNSEYFNPLIGVAVALGMFKCILTYGASRSKQYLKNLRALAEDLEKKIHQKPEYDKNGNIVFTANDVWLLIQVLVLLDQASRYEGRAGSSGALLANVLGTAQRWLTFLFAGVGPQLNEYGRFEKNTAGPLLKVANRIREAAGTPRSEMKDYGYGDVFKCFLSRQAVWYFHRLFASKEKPVQGISDATWAQWLCFCCYDSPAPARALASDVELKQIGGGSYTPPPLVNGEAKGEEKAPANEDAKAASIKKAKEEGVERAKNEERLRAVKEEGDEGCIDACRSSCSRGFSRFLSLFSTKPSDDRGEPLLNGNGNNGLDRLEAHL